MLDFIMYMYMVNLHSAGSSPGAVLLDVIATVAGLAIGLVRLRHTLGVSPSSPV